MDDVLRMEADYEKDLLLREVFQPLLSVEEDASAFLDRFKNDVPDDGEHIVLLTGVVFAAMMQMLVAALGFPGKFIAVVLLMLQLTSAAGTFPIETVPEFFQVINPLLPMTYAVRALRVATTGVDLSLIGPNVLALLAFGGLSFAVTCLVARRRRLITLNDLHPLVDLEA